MKRLSLFLVAVWLCACNNNSTEPAKSDDSSSTGGVWRESELAPEPAVFDKADYFVWDVDVDKRTLIKNPLFQPSFLQVDTFITGLNERYPNVKLEKQRLSGDTLYTEIKDAAYLTNQMGSAGSEQYIAEVVINLTAVNGVKYVSVNFAEGSHASPDVWSRESFDNFKEQKVEY